MYNLECFKWFISERESIKNLRLSGQPRPWTTDKILNETKFTNINRLDDFGTISLIKFKNKHKLNINQTVFYCMVFRFMISTRDFFINLTGDFEKDKIIIKQGHFNYGKMPYQIFLNKNQTIQEFVNDYIVSNTYNKFLKKFKNYKNNSIIDASFELSEIVGEDWHRKLKFISSEVIKDLSYFYPEKINPDSKCILNCGAILGLKHLNCLSNTNEERMKELIKITNLNYAVLEHALCEWGKYIKRDIYFKEHGKFPKSNTFIQRTDINNLLI